MDSGAAIESDSEGRAVDDEDKLVRQTAYEQAVEQARTESDAIGSYRLGRSPIEYRLTFALEAKCYAPANGVGVKELSSLISRLRYREFGILVTASYLGKQAYEELRFYRRPVIVISGADIAAILLKAGLSTTKAVRGWLETAFPKMEAILMGKSRGELTARQPRIEDYYDFSMLKKEWLGESFLFNDVVAEGDWWYTITGLNPTANKPVLAVCDDGRRQPDLQVHRRGGLQGHDRDGEKAAQARSEAQRRAPAQSIEVSKQPTEECHGPRQPCCVSAGEEA